VLDEEDQFKMGRLQGLDRRKWARGVLDRNCGLIHRGRTKDREARESVNNLQIRTLRSKLGNTKTDLPKLRGRPEDGDAKLHSSDMGKSAPYKHQVEKCRPLSNFRQGKGILLRDQQKVLS